MEHRGLGLWVALVAVVFFACEPSDEVGEFEEPEVPREAVSALDPACSGTSGSSSCPGESIVLTQGTDLTLCGSIGSTDNHTGYFCAAGTTAAGESIFALDVQQEGTLKLSVRSDTTGTSFNPAIYARSNCTDGTSASAGGCWDFFAGGESIAEDWDLSYLPNPVYIFVDGDQAGDFVLDVSLEAAACGDGVVNRWTPATPEECDDGNTVSGDGCSSTCMLEAPGPSDSCPGQIVQIAKGQTLSVSGRTTGYTDTYQPDPLVGSCANVATGGSDRVFQVTPLEAGTLTARVGLGPTCTDPLCETAGLGSAAECWDQVLWVIDGTSCGTDTVIACADDGLVQEEVSFVATALDDYTVVVDGYADYAFGNFNLCLSLQ